MHSAHLSLTPSVETDGRDRIGFFQDDDLIRNANIRGASERRGDDGGSPSHLGSAVKDACRSHAAPGVR